MASDTNELLEKLRIAVEAGEITSDDLDKVAVISLTENLKDAVCLVHHYFCNHYHGLGPGHCTFYSEEEQPRTWTRPWHRIWLSATTLMLRNSGMTEAQLLDRIREFYQMKDKLNWFAKFYFLYEAKAETVQLVVDFKRIVNPMLVQNSNKEEEGT